MKDLIEVILAQWPNLVIGLPIIAILVFLLFERQKTISNKDGLLDNHNDLIKNYESMRKTLREELDAQNKKIAEQNKKIDDKNKRIEDLDRNNKELAEQCNDLQNQLQKTNINMEVLQESLIEKSRLIAGMQSSNDEMYGKLANLGDVIIELINHFASKEDNIVNPRVMKIIKEKLKKYGVEKEEILRQNNSLEATD